MTSKPRKSIDTVMMSDERSNGPRGSVFDRLGAKQIMSQQQQQQIRSNPNKIQSASSSIYDSTDARRRKALGHSSHTRHYHDEQYDESNTNPHHYPQAPPVTSQSANRYSTSVLNNKQMLKSKINKTNYNREQYKKHFNEQGAEVLEKKRVEITRELKKIDQRDHSNRHAKSSPCSSQSACSSSGSGSGSESYTGSSSSTCSSSSCRSSSFSEDEERTTSHKNYKKNVANMSMQPTMSAGAHSQRSKSHMAIDKARAQMTQAHHQAISSPPPSHHAQHHHHSQALNNSKRFSNQTTPPAPKRVRSRSPQSTTSSYYSRKSRAGPLTPPLPTSSHHSLSNMSNPATSSSSSLKLDRHGNVRVSLKEKERHRKTPSALDKQTLNSSSPIFNYSKSSRSPLDRSRDDLYSSPFGSVDDRKKFTPSPVNYNHHGSSVPLSLSTSTHQRKASNPNFSSGYDDRSPSSFSFCNTNSKSVSSSIARQQYHLSPVDHHGQHVPRTPPQPSHHSNHMLNKYNYHHSHPNNGDDYDEHIAHQITPHSLDPVIGNRHASAQMKRNKFNSNNFGAQQSSLSQQSTTYSPLRTAKSSSSNIHHQHSYQNPHAYTERHPQSQQKPPQQQPLLPLKQSKPVINYIGTNQTKKNFTQTLVKQQTASLSSSAKPVNQMISDESISNYSLEDTDIDDSKDRAVVKKKDEIVPVSTQISKEDDEEEEGEAKDETEVTYKKETQEENVNESNVKNEEAFSEENFSEWSDVEDYDYNNQSNSTPPNDSKSLITTNKVALQDNYDDLKFKIDEELEAISDEEFDAMIDEQDNEKNGMMSCKQVLDQLDINWASLMCESNDLNGRQSISKSSSSARSRFRSAQLLSQIGISSKHCSSALNDFIESYCALELNDENFKFRSPIALLHSLRSRTKSDQRNATDDHCRPTVNGQKIYSFNHLIVNLRKKTLQTDVIKPKETTLINHNTPIEQSND